MENSPIHSQQVKDTENITEFWCSVSELKRSDGELMFPILSNFMINLLVLPHSLVAVERIFSQN